MIDSYCAKVEELLCSAVDSVQSGIGSDSGMMVGKLEHRSICLDEVFKVHAYLSLPIGPDDEPGIMCLTALPGS